MGLLKRVPSASNPHVMYEISMGNNGHIYCSCPAWKNQKNKQPRERSCKHIKAYIRESGLPEELATRPRQE